MEAVKSEGLEVAPAAHNVRTSRPRWVFVAVGGATLFYILWGIVKIVS